MALDLETMLAPVTEAEPAGPDLAYDPARAEIDQAFDRPASIDATTGKPLAAPDVDWRRITRLIEGQIAQSKDLWLAVYLCRAGAWASDLDMVATGAEFLAGLCERYWEGVHPSLEEYGIQGRKGPCESLASIGDFLNPLRESRLLDHPRLGRFSGADFERFRAGGEAENGYDQFRAALNDTPDETLVGIGERLDRTTVAIRRVDAVLMANAQGGTGANFQATYETLGQIRRAVLSFAASPPPETAPADEPARGDTAGAGPAARRAGAIESRQDVLAALDAIADYYRRREPASPVPLVLQRAREWINLDFLGVLADIAPGSIEEARRVLTFKRPDS